MKVYAQDRVDVVTKPKEYECSCGKVMEKNMRAIRAHVATECPNVKRRL